MFVILGERENWKFSIIEDYYIMCPSVLPYTVKYLMYAWRESL